MIKDKETCCFLHVVKNVLSSDGYYLLTVKDSGDIQSDKVFMGYYDEKFIYLVPKRIIHCCNAALEFNGLEPFNMKRILEHLFALDLIKVHWVLSKEVRYRSQKDTSAQARRENQVQRFPAKRDNAYITLNRIGFENFFKEDNSR